MPRLGFSLNIMTLSSTRSCYFGGYPRQDNQRRTRFNLGTGTPLHENYDAGRNNRRLHEQCVIMSNRDCQQVQEAMKRILLVDDDDALRFLCRSYFERKGFDCEEASDGMAALEYLRAQQFDVVLTDHDMPGLNGLELLETIATDPSHASTPVILLTGNPSESIFRQASRIGVFAVASKPSALEDLHALVIQALAPSQ